MSYTSTSTGGNTTIDSSVVNNHPLNVIISYNNHLSTGVKNHCLIFWKELVGEELYIYLERYKKQ